VPKNRGNNKEALSNGEKPVIASSAIVPLEFVRSSFFTATVGKSLFFPDRHRFSQAAARIPVFHGAFRKGPPHHLKFSENELRPLKTAAIFDSTPLTRREITIRPNQLRPTVELRQVDFA